MQYQVVILHRIGPTFVGWFKSLKAARGAVGECPQKPEELRAAVYHEGRLVSYKPYGRKRFVRPCELIEYAQRHNVKLFVDTVT